jgi:hypothetical protein
MSGHIALEYPAPSSPEITVPEEWLTVSHDVSALIREKLQVRGITAAVDPGSMRLNGAPAWWDPFRKELVIDPDVAVPGQDPVEVDIGDALWRAGNPVIMGLLYHECGHIIGTRYTALHYLRSGVERRVADVVSMLDEPYCEKVAVGSLGTGTVQYLRASAVDLILREFVLPETVYGLASAAALILARQDAGVLSNKECQPYWDMVVAGLGEQRLGDLRGVWTRYLDLAVDEDWRERSKLGEEWLAIIGEDPTSGPVANSGLRRESEQDGEGSGEQSGEGMSSVVRRHAGEIDRSFVSRRRTIREGREARAAQDAAAVQQESEASQESVAEADEGGGVGDGGWARRSFRRGTREPTVEERRGMVLLAERLEQADFRARTVSRGTSESPPGRLRQTAMDLESAAELGIPPTRTDIFAVRRRKADFRPPLTVGLMTDVSGSMSQTVEALCTTQWMLSNAVQRIHGRTASMFFGIGHYRGLRLGERQDTVDVWNASDGHEKPFGAFGALDAQLDLLGGEGARLLVIATDARWSQPDQVKRMKKVVQAARRSELQILWCVFSGSPKYSQDYNYGTVLDLRKVPTVDAARKIGDAVVGMFR